MSFSQTAQQWLKILPGLSLSLSGLLLALPEMLPAHPDVALFLTKLSVIAKICHQHTCILRGCPEGHCIGPVNSKIWPLLDSGVKTGQNSTWLPAAGTYFADGYTRNQTWFDFHYFFTILLFYFFFAYSIPFFNLLQDRIYIIFLIYYYTVIINYHTILELNNSYHCICDIWKYRTISTVNW